MVFHNGSTSLHSHQQWFRVSLPPQPGQHLFCFLIITILTVVQWNFVFFICSSLVASDPCLNHFHFVLRKMPIPKLCAFLNSITLLLSSLSLLHVLDMTTLSDCFLCSATVSQLDLIPLVNFCFYFLCFQGLIEEVLAQSVFCSVSPMSCCNLMTSGLMFRSLIHLLAITFQWFDT